MRILLLCLILMGSVVSLEATGDNIPNRVLYLMHKGHSNEAFQLYRLHRNTTGRHDYDLLQQMGFLILDEGHRQADPEVTLLTLFGAGISAHERTLYILDAGLNSQHPQLQLVSLNFLAKFQNHYTDAALKQAMHSNFLPIRLEAAFLLSGMKHPSAVSQTESLMYKLPDAAAPIFPQFFGRIGTAQAITMLRKLMTHSNQEVRVETINSCSEFGRDDLLPQIRSLATQHNVQMQEACARAFGTLQDENSIDQLGIFARSSVPSVRLASLVSLYKLGRTSAKGQIEQMARQGDLFAVANLGALEGTELLLVELMHSTDIQVRLNATIALLLKQDPLCLSGLSEFLIQDSRDLAIVKIISQGKALNAWKVIPSAAENFQDKPVLHELSLHLKEEILKQTLALDEKEFLQLSNTLLQLRQNTLVPCVTQLLTTLNTPDAIALLKHHQQQAGAPLVRNYCNLALFRLKEEGPYEENLYHWVRSQQKENFIQFRPVVPWEMRSSHTPHTLTPEETSRLLIESFETVAQAQNTLGVDILLDAIQHGNPKNRYALAGLLIRTTD